MLRSAKSSYCSFVMDQIIMKLLSNKGTHNSQLQSEINSSPEMLSSFPDTLQCKNKPGLFNKVFSGSPSEEEDSRAPQSFQSTPPGLCGVLGLQPEVLVAPSSL